MSQRLLQRYSPRQRVIVIFSTAIVSLTLILLISHMFFQTKAKADSVLDVPYLSQYQNQPTENYDCGPASVAMIVQFFGDRPNNISDQDFVTQVRNATDNTAAKDTTFSDLETAISSFNLTYSEITNAATPQPTTQIQAIQNAVNSGEPVIALLHGADLGRGSKYGDHWVVVTGFSDDGNSVYLNDADNQSARGRAGWIVGGQITLPFSTFSSAIADAQEGSYGIIVNKTLNLCDGSMAILALVGVVGVLSFMLRK